MDPRLDLITLGVPDLAAARRFYVEGLGWEPVFENDAVCFVQVGHGRLLSLFGSDALAADIAGTPAAATEAEPGAGMTLAQVVETEDEVRAALERAEAAGATVLKAPQRADFGGYHGYFADPAGFRWEVATNPGWSVDADGIVTLRAVEG